MADPEVPIVILTSPDTADRELVDAIRVKAWQERKPFSDVVREVIRTRRGPNWHEPVGGHVALGSDVREAFRAYLGPKWCEKADQRAAEA